MSGVLSRSFVGVDAWDKFVSSHADGWWFHTSAWLDYAAAYSPTAVDASLAYVDDDCEVSAVVPLLVEPDGTPVCGGQLTPAPLSSPEISVLAPISKKIKWAYRPGQAIEDFPVDYVERDATTFVVDTLQSEKELWRRLRKSYKSLIHRADERFGTTIYRGPCEIGAAKSAVEVAHELHRRSAGRETRSQRTWDLQASWLASGDAVLSVATAGLTPVGFAYTIAWKDWAYYASGAALEDDVSHLLIWKSIQSFAVDREIRYFEIGHADETGNEKERSIAFFKSGFGGDRWTYKTATHKEYA